MRRFLFILLLSIIVVSAACLGSENGGGTTPSPSTATNSQAGTTTSQEPTTWDMEIVWNLSTSGIPFMDLSPDGSLSAVIDWDDAYLYLVRPDGESVSFDLQGHDAVKPVVSGVVVKDDKAYVLAGYAEFAGLRIYSWGGQTGEERHGWAGSVADWIARSSSGNHLCYLITTGATRQELYCDGVKTVLENAGDYGMVGVSDTGLVAVGDSKKGVLLFKNGSKILTLNPESHMVVLYGDRIIGGFEGKLKVLDLEGNTLAESEKYDLRWMSLIIPTVRATKDYIIWTDEYSGTHVLDWNLREVKSLPGLMRFANENFVVTEKEGVIHCYSLRDFHEVFSVEAPVESMGYVELSEDGRVMLVSGEYGDFWLYTSG
ncbi:hypothetical protein A3L11_04175 [Thermococcus siculi]|uniref:Dehydrogenase n=1 Tax=Thermococcus siculi TaxID=72803 RepID=A0A2Z2MX33_9EURY|nr:hypothetical protein [Thermococcus siculi]ASJ08470.1 hypothetical protein A3L11_04175 [Thermococcus siculi]